MTIAHDDQSRARRKAADLRLSARAEEADAMRARYPAPFFRRADNLNAQADLVLVQAGLDPQKENP